MEIFVRAWKDSDGDGIGDLRGLTGRAWTTCRTWASAASG
jgi:hypothetical protein